MKEQFLGWCFLILLVSIIIGTIKIVFIDTIRDIYNRNINENKDGDGI